MRILLDESLPRPLARLLPEHDVRTVAAMGWTGKHQQNLGALPIAVIVLVAPTNRIESLRPLIPTLLQTLQALVPRQLVYVSV